MESSIVTAIFLPVALGIMMFGMGINLTAKDFRFVLEKPRLIFIGLLTQVLVVPALAWLVAKYSELPPALAIGLVLVAACPIGTVANVMVHMAKGDSAYSISLTAISSLLSVLTIPFIVNLSSISFLGQETTVHLPVLTTVLQVFMMIILPVTLGLLLRRARPDFVQKLDRPLRIISLLFLIVIVTGAIVKERNNLVGFILQAGMATLVLNGLVLLLAFVVGRLLIGDKLKGRALFISTGMRNSTLAIAIASSPHLLNNPTMAIPAAIYSIFMFLTTVTLVLGIRSRKSDESPGEDTEVVTAY